MKTFLVQVGADAPRKMSTPEEVQFHLTALLAEHGWNAEAADSAARTTARRLNKGGRYAPDHRVTDVCPGGAWVRAWWEEAA